MSLLENTRLFFREISEFKIFLSPSNLRERQLVFYSEHGAYGKFFNPIVDEMLINKNFKFSYLTSDSQDIFFQRKLGQMKVFYIKAMLGGLLPQLDAKALVMTMPDLEHFHIKRSRKGTEHVYFFHALVSTHMIYRKGAFDHYDTIFCAGPHHVTEILRTEKVYGVKSKKLVAAGYPLLDKIYADFQVYTAGKVRKPGEAPTVLIAPSWAPGNIMLSCLDPLIQSLSESGFRIIVRPHPEFIKRCPKELEKLKQKSGGMRSVEFEIYPRKENSLFEADVLVTDWSGIALEYAFGTERPVLFMDTPRKVLNPEYERLEIEPIEVALRDKIGCRMALDDVSSAGQNALELLKHTLDYRASILHERGNAVFHFGRSAAVMAEYLRKFA